MMTEYEWRMSTAGPKRKRSSLWGAQCMLPSRSRRVFHDRFFQHFLLLCSLTAAILLPVMIGERPGNQIYEFEESPQQRMDVRKVEEISYELPMGLNSSRQFFDRGDMLHGKMLLMDRMHTLPSDIPPPNTAAIAKQGNGMIPVRSLSVKSGWETIEALSELFGQLRQSGAEGLYVWEGIVTSHQQRIMLLDSVRERMRVCSPEKAVEEARNIHDLPGNGEMLLEYTVEIRQLDSATRMPSDMLLDETKQGQRLLQLAWRYGFIRSSAEHPYRFRYVGKAHAKAMTYLGLDLKEYLEWMHQKEQLVIYHDGKPQYLILCTPMREDYCAFDLPEECSYEISMDNTGYALAACVL